jgi:hypothetical protein
MTKPARALAHYLSAPGREVRRWVRRWRDGLRPAASAVLLALGRVPAADRAAGIRLIDVRALASFRHDDAGGVLVIMPSIRVRKAVRAARTLIERAGMSCTVLIVRDSPRRGFVAACNAAVERSAAKYVVYLAEDAFPGLDWLRLAHEALERSGKGLLGFNDGKWRGRIAAFGMVRLDWVRPIYGGPLFYPGYVAHKADNELTVIARAQDRYVYDPDCTLFEYDPGKVFGGRFKDDRATFRARFRSGFDGLIPIEKLAPLAREYGVPWDADTDALV